MTSPIISVEGLSKSYLVGHESANREKYTALRDVVGRTVKNFGRKALDMARGRQIIHGDEVEEFFALKDISFDIDQGEVVGIIGRNGAGKSTLLKVLSRITEPTHGRVTLRGRVASLLEVGTGFHPELTGRENIFLNGAVLGMTRGEIKRKFEEIVEFAGVEKFLDTPVKRYSSGMYVRLAFAVAAHLDPEILVIDEVLAVGDAQFQKKCLGKMKDVAKSGRTVLFVSHQLGSVRSLCSRAIWLHNGSIVESGDASPVVDSYLSGTHVSSERIELNHDVPVDVAGIEFTQLEIDARSGVVKTGDGLSIRMMYEASISPKSPAFVVQIFDSVRNELLRLSTMPISGFPIEGLHPRGEVVLRIPALPFVPGIYSIDIGVVEERVRWIVKCSEAAVLRVETNDPYRSGYCLESSQGRVVTEHEWEHKLVGS